jgi:hypothetical protein
MGVMVLQIMQWCYLIREIGTLLEFPPCERISTLWLVLADLEELP